MAPKTVRETFERLDRIINQFSNTDMIYGEIADIMADICHESLDPSKLTGYKVGYAGSPLIDEWEYKDNAYPFHIYDPITRQNVPDPRVIFIGKFVYQIGENIFGDGMPDMQTVYQLTAQRIHTAIFPLSHAWDGIGSWRH